jgi:hypothetical protein
VKLGVKAGSPGPRNKMMIETASPPSKLCFNNPGKIKRVKKPGVGEKAVTETGPIIQRTLNS